MENQDKNDVLEPTEQTEPTENPAPPPVSFADDPEIAAFIELKVNEGIQKALQGKPPRANTADPTEQQRKTFEKMTYRERLNLFNSDPQTYNKLSKGATNYA